MKRNRRSYLHGPGLRFNKFRLKRILKQPGKLVFYLFTIMFLIVRDSHELGPCFQNCFGPATKIKIYNYASYGLIHVNGTTVVATQGAIGILYKISAGPHFYLYDPEAKKFICWKRPHRTKGRHGHSKKHKTHELVARNVSININCQFLDIIDADTYDGYVSLVPAFKPKLKMMFNKSGMFVSQNCRGLSKLKKPKSKCIDKSNFLIDAYSIGGCECPEARNLFCDSKLKRMKVFESICSRSNETYDS